MPAPTPRSIGSFEIERELGRGGMGVVYLAKQPGLERRVVLKTLHREAADDARVVERFRREARAAAGVHHQNVVGVYDCFDWRGRPYMALEYVEGEDLASALRGVRSFEPRVAALVALELLRGLEEIHAGGVVHRDLKPANVLLGRSGHVKVADFGIALGNAKAPALTQTGEAVGTPRYMSPEQLYGERVDERSDLFSWGVLLYEMLTGRPPFEDDGEPEAGPAVRRIESGRYPRVRRLAPGAPRWLARQVQACLRAKPRRRPGSASALRGVLEARLGAPSPADARREIAAWLWQREVFGAADDATVAAPRAAKPVRRLPLHWLAAAVALVALALGVWVLEGRPETAPRLYRLFGLAGPGPVLSAQSDLGRARSEDAAEP
jgi:serine/threonine-protein kinase